MGELTKVRKEFTARYDIIVSPVRIEILRSLSENPNGLSFQEIVNHIPEDMRQRNILKHLDQLIRENLVVATALAVAGSLLEKKYSLTESGKVNYDKLVEIARELKAEESHTKSE